MTNQFGDHVSASQLGTFKACPERWRQRYVLHRDDPSNTAGLAGRCAHKALELWERSGRTQDLKTLFRDDLSKVVNETDLSGVVVLGRTSRTAAEDMLWRVDGMYRMLDAAEKEIRRSGLVPEKLPDGQPAVEVQFELHLPGDVLVVGSIDAVMVDVDGGLTIRDYKSGQRTAGAGQLLVYRDAWREIFGQDITHGEYYYLKDGVKGTHNLAAYPPDYVSGQLAKMAKIIEQDLYLPSPGGHCNMCPFRDYCEEGH